MAIENVFNEVLERTLPISLAREIQRVQTLAPSEHYLCIRDIEWERYNHHLPRYRATTLGAGTLRGSYVIESVGLLSVGQAGFEPTTP